MRWRRRRRRRGGIEEDDEKGAEDDAAEPTAGAGGKGRPSGVDSSLAELLKDAREGAATMKSAPAMLTAEAQKQRDHAAAEGERQRAHDAEMEKAHAAQQKELIMGMMAALAQRQATQP